MSAGPGFYPGGYAAPPGYGYPQYGQPPVGGGAFQQGGGYGGAQQHLGGGSAGKYGGAGYGEGRLACLPQQWRVARLPPAMRALARECESAVRS